jgi:hypothetical protein
MSTSQNQCSVTPSRQVKAGSLPRWNFPLSVYSNAAALAGVESIRLHLIILLGIVLTSHLVATAGTSQAGPARSSRFAADKLEIQLARCEERLETLREFGTGSRYSVMLGLIRHLDELAASDQAGPAEKAALAAFGGRMLDYAEEHRNDPEFQHAVFHAELSGLGQVLVTVKDIQRFTGLTNHIMRAQVPRCLASAKAGLAYAQIDLARVYQSGRFGVPQDFEEALKWYRKAAEQGSSIGEMGIGGMYERGEGVVQSFGEAAKWYRKAAARGAVGDRNNLAWFLATCPDATVRNGSEAVAMAESAVLMTGRRNADFLDTLAAAYAETGQFAEAVRTQKEAIALLSDGDKKVDFMTRLKLFESKSAYHQPLGQTRYRGIELEEPER